MSSAKKHYKDKFARHKYVASNMCDFYCFVRLIRAAVSAGRNFVSNFYFLLFVYLVLMDTVSGRRRQKNQKRPNTETELKNGEKIRILIMNPPSWDFMLLLLLGLSTFGYTCYFYLQNATFFL